MTHTMAMNDLHRGSYTGQFGFLVVESGTDPGRYDQEVFLALRDWEPFFTNMFMDTDDQNQKWPQPEKPAVLDTSPNGLEVASNIFSINDKALGAGEPIRVRQGQRVLMHFLNASAIENRNIALPGHQFHVLALDGNPVPTPMPTDQLLIGPGERRRVKSHEEPAGSRRARDVRGAGLGIVFDARTSVGSRSGWRRRNRPGTTRALERPPRSRPPNGRR